MWSRRSLQEISEKHIHRITYSWFSSNIFSYMNTWGMCQVESKSKSKSKFKSSYILQFKIPSNFLLSQSCPLNFLSDCSWDGIYSPNCLNHASLLFKRESQCFPAWKAARHGCTKSWTNASTSTVRLRMDNQPLLYL